LQVLALNALTPILRRIDSSLPFAPLSLIAVLEPAGGVGAAVPGREAASSRAERA
jgi:hypothetical protein